MGINENLSNLMKEAQKMQQRMQEVQEELSKKIVEGESGGGKVKAKMNGRYDVIAIKIDSYLMTQDIEMLEDLVAAAVNDAVRKVEKASKEKINQLAAGLKIPADFMEDDDRKGG
jgi:nucleoid-associated protein EbfC